MKKLNYIILLIVFILINKVSAFEVKPDSSIKPVILKDSIRCRNHAARFIDKNNDGLNDEAPDEDGDGIPNGLDPDYKAKKEKIHKGMYYNTTDSSIIKKRQQKGFRFRHRWKRNR